MTTSTTVNLTATAIAAAMDDPGHFHLPAFQTQSLTVATAQDWSAFAAEWDRLTPDRYMADGGTYRMRRYSRFLLDARGELVGRPHGPYVQSTDINRLNGGIERHFDPCTVEFVTNPVLLGLLPALGSAFTQAHGSHQWDIKLHPYRILATATAVGQPAPEGRHRDGVTYIMTLLIHRHQITGGASTVYAEDGTELDTRTLQQRGEMLIADDRATLHSVTPIVAVTGARRGYRDVLVIAFTAVDS